MFSKLTQWLLGQPSQEARDEHWWRNHYPGDRIISASGAPYPVFKENYERWKALCEAQGFGPRARPLDDGAAEIHFQLVTNPYDPDDPQLAEPADREALRLALATGTHLPRIQFWQFHGAIVELRLWPKGFIYRDGKWLPFNDAAALLSFGVPISYNDAKCRVGAEMMNTNEINFLETVAKD